MREPISLLIVDDDPAVATAARTLLSRRGCRLEAVFSGLDAVARIRAGGIDAVLLDVWMPEVTGLTVLDELSGLPNPPRVVLMSGNIDASVEAAVTAGRALACLSKPVDFELALTLLNGEAPDRPLQLTPALDRGALNAFAAQAISRGTGFLEGAPQLPAGTAVSLTLDAPGGPLTLLAIAEQGSRPAGKRGLGVRLAELTPSQLQSLRAIGSAIPTAVVERPEPPNRALELYRRGLERLEASKYDRALTDLRAARDLDPSDPLIHAAMMRAEVLAGVEKARGLFNEALELGEKDPRGAVRMMEDAIRLDPSRAAYHREAARLYLQLGDSLQEAEAQLAAAIHLAPSDPAPRLHLAQLLDRVGRPREAVWACEAGLQLFPGDHDLQKLLARVKRKRQPERE